VAGDTELRAIKVVPRAAIAAGHPDACLAVQKIAQFVGSFSSRDRPLPSGLHDCCTAQEVPW